MKVGVNMGNPEVSIIMSVYNETQRQLNGSIQSILNQTYDNFEFIIMNDNPLKIELQKYLKQLEEKDSRICIVRNNENIGLTDSLNKALKLVKGQYIARMDADDISMLNRLEKQVIFLNENTNIDLVGTNCIFIDENDNELWRGEDLPTNPKFIAKTLKYVNYFKHPSWMFRKEILNDIKEYRDIKYAEDYDFLSRLILNNNQLSNINEPLIKYRIRSNGISCGNYLEQLKAAEYVNYLSEQKIHNNNDNYNKSDMIKYLECTEKEKGNNIKANIYFNKATFYKKGKMKIRAIICLAINSILCKHSFKRNIKILKYKILTKLNKN